MNSQQILEKLVSFDTTSWKSNLDLIDFISDYLSGFGIKSRLIHNAEENKANLLATLGPDDLPGIILSGHTDVVPVEGQDWSSDPFTLRDGGDKLYGRGTCDMKGFIACVLAAVPDYVARGLTEPLHLAFSYDEEVGCTGVSSLIDVVKDMAVRPRACIVGEPTNMKVVNSHKGICHLLTKIYGRESHSSSTQGTNAVMLAADMIHHLSAIGEEFKGRTPLVDGFDPPFTTVHVGRIKGGFAANITPAYCEFEWDYRPLPGSDAGEVFDRLEQYIAEKIIPRMKDGRVETDFLSRVVPLTPQSGSDAETLVLALAEQNELGVVSYATEAGLFQQNGGVPSVVCGPGSIGEAHKPDEYIEKTELDACDHFLKRLGDIVCP